jgi:hypothetical protein
VPPETKKSRYCRYGIIGKELHDPAIVPENVYNMDETGVLLSVLSSLKVLVSKQDLRKCRGAGVQRTRGYPLIRHVSEAHNHEFYSHFLLFSTTIKVLIIVQMPKVIKANSKAIRNSVKKAKNIQLAMQAYKNPFSGLSLRAAALFYDYNKDSITNHLNDTPEISQIRYAPDVYVERQLFNAAEETALYNHILECYESHLSLDVELLYHYANELLQARLGPLREEDKVRTNWHIRFY